MEPTQQAMLLTPGKRPETGPLQFGKDWPGVFIRGDNAIMYATAIDAGDFEAMAELASLLRSCIKDKS